MKLLAVDTALGACSVAVLDGEKILSHRFEEMARGHAEALAPMVEAAMGDSGLTFANLERLAVTTGPGTFTGQRVGLAFMRGLKVALKKPLIGLTTLEAMAAAASFSTPLRPASASREAHGGGGACSTQVACDRGVRKAEGETKAAAIHDAKREEAYLLLWENGETVFAPAVMSFADAVEKIHAFGPCALAGTGAAAAREMLGAAFTLTDIRQPDALWVARLALTRVDMQTPPAPLYLRAPDAKLPGGKVLGEA